MSILGLQLLWTTLSEKYSLINRTQFSLSIYWCFPKTMLVQSDCLKKGFMLKSQKIVQMELHWPQ